MEKVQAIRLRVVIVDDHPIVRAGIAQVLSREQDMEVCGEAANATEAIQVIRDRKPDLALVDISLEGTNGIELVKQIKALDEKVVSVVISMHDDNIYAERSLRAGAMGYINKQEVAETIVAAIRQVMRGQVYLGKNVADEMLLRAVSHKDGATRSPIECLSDRELEVFEMIGRGITTADIARRLHLSTKTIETHRENIKAKLQIHNANELIHHAVQWTLENK